MSAWVCDRWFCGVCQVDTRCDEVWCSRRIVQWYGTSKKEKRRKKGISIIEVNWNNLVHCCRSCLVVKKLHLSCGSYELLVFFQGPAVSRERWCDIKGQCTGVVFGRVEGIAKVHEKCIAAPTEAILDI